MMLAAGEGLRDIRGWDGRRGREEKGTANGMGQLLQELGELSQVAGGAEPGSRGGTLVSFWKRC